MKKILVHVKLFIVNSLENNKLIYYMIWYFRVSLKYNNFATLVFIFIIKFVYIFVILSKFVMFQVHVCVEIIGFLFSVEFVYLTKLKVGHVATGICIVKDTERRLQH